MPTDLFADPIYEKPANRPGTTGDLYAPGNDWQWRMESFAQEHGMKIEGQRQDATFRMGGKWYAVERNPDTEELEVMQL
jgi:hypothetical protein